MRMKQNLRILAGTVALATPSAYAVTIYLLTILFAILSVVGFALAIRSFGFPMNRAARLHTIAVAFAASAGQSFWPTGE